MDKLETKKAAAESALADAQQFFGGDAFQAFIRLLDALDELYGEELKSSSVETTPKKQAAARQCGLLREALMERSSTALPKM